MNEMINATTSLLPLLTIDQKNSYYYNISIFCFSLVATVNHVLPENLDGMTHVVKLLFSNILFSLVDFNPILGFILSLSDLTPLLSENKKVKNFGEKFMQLPRLIIEIYLMYLSYEIHQVDCCIMMVCKIIYYFERRSRIKNGIRNDYSSWHAAEHVGLYLLFKARTEVEFSLSLYAIIFFIFITLIGIFLHLINRILEYNLFTRAPSWVMENPDLKSILENKLNRNKYSLKYRNYVMKPWTSHLKLEFVTWTKIQTVCNEILKNVDANDYDIVVGISTGGSFVGAYIAKELKKPYSIIHSKFWSGINFKQNFVQTMLYVFGVEQRSKMGDLPDVKGKRVLLVDDTSYTGITINGIKNTLLEKGEPKSVTTMVMWVRDKNKSTDFYQDTKRVPIIWEWGSEVD